MYVTVATLLALQCTLCLTIRVPIAWTDESSEVNKNSQFAFEQFEPQNIAGSSQKDIPKEYFQYTAQKPKFAVEIAKLHGVPSPENHYKAYPIEPHTGIPKPQLGKHQIPNKEKNSFNLYHVPEKKNGAIRTVSPSSTSYEVFHPYKLEEPALKQLYRDPVMEKIRNDIENNKIRLQKYENEAGQVDIIKGESLESPEEIDQNKLPHKNVPAPYEIHRPERRPIYYKPPSIHNNREQVLNQKLRHPLHQNHVKVKPIHYYPVKNHLHRLRQQQALKYDDERNEYPQLPIPEKYNEPSDGYDIYEKGKAKFVQLRNNVDESLNEAVQKNRPVENQKLELTNDEHDEDANSEEDEDDFVPVKNYAQVRKTETTKHLPKEAAYHDADTLEEIQNAPRLREAIKSSKAQTVYSEEGYEDSAYDHAGEQKHASDHEEHRGFLKEKEQSNGKYKTPKLNSNYEDGEGSEYRNQVLDGKKWKDTTKHSNKETDVEDYSDKEHENSDESETYIDKSKSNEKDDNEPEDELNYDSQEEERKRIKREPINDANNDFKSSSINSKTVNSGENTTKLKHLDTKSNLKKISGKNILRLSTSNVSPKSDNTNEKYPYYYNKFKGISKDSPLRYAENLKFIPNKSEGGTEFYDSREKFICPEVEDNIDPIPEKLKKDGHPDDYEESEYDDVEGGKQERSKSDSSVENQMPKLKGLGDKIDCFKAKYFGENPLDSPFFKEEIISNPEPVTIPSIDIYRLKQEKQQSNQKLKLTHERDLYKKLKEKRKNETIPLLDKFYQKQNVKNLNHEINVQNIEPTSLKTKITKDQSISLTSDSVINTPVQSQTLEQKDGIKYLNHKRKRRAAPFVYEPYKIIRDSQIQDSKKTTTTNNISPLIKQLQSSRVVDKVTTNTGKDQIVKRSASTRHYKDIGKTEREKITESKGSQPLYDAKFVDVSIDQRRGEPRYELRSINHRSQHSPVENKSSMAAEDYKGQTKSNIKNESEQEEKSQNRRRNNRSRRPTTTRPYFDVSKFLPQEETSKTDPINSEIETITEQPISQLDKNFESNEKKEHFTEDDDDNEKVLDATTSTTAKVPFRRKISHVSTTLKPEKEDDLPKLRLVTRFHDSFHTEQPVTSKSTEIPTHIYEHDKKTTLPKYREKKKKISKSTLVTDTNSYGEDDDDDLSKEEEVDALIGVKHDIEEYLPTYEIEAGKKDKSDGSHAESQDAEDDYEEDSHNYDHDDEDSDDDEDDEDDDEDEEDDEGEIEEDSKPEATTLEPVKRTLIRTTEAPSTTTEARSAKLEIEPVVTKKKLDIHKELPTNRSSPHKTEFKQDIKEVEIIKEIPMRKRKKPQKNIEALELYKDENLAKDINKLGGVEVFKEDLDLINGPKHGGNYRSAETLNTDDSVSSSSQRRQNENNSKGDVVASQSKTSKIIEIKDDPYSRRRSNIQRVRNNRNRSAKLIELSETTENPSSRPMHGGNFKSIHDMRRRGGSRNAKLIELVDQTNTNDHSTTKHDDNSRSYGSRGGNRHQMHGGNYRSAKLVKTDEKARTTTENVPKKDPATDVRQNSAVLLNSFARAVSVLTTPTPYILDPSKRMYYYVE